MKYNLHIKSGTAGYIDKENKDFIVASGIVTNFLPRIGEKVKVTTYTKNYAKDSSATEIIERKYIVTDIEHETTIFDSSFLYQQSIKPPTVYCVPADGISYNNT